MRPLRPRGLTQGVAPAALTGPEELARALGRERLIRLGSNESPFGPSPKALAAIRGEAARVNRYGDPSEGALREAIAAHHGVGIESVTVGAGIDDLLGWIVRAYLPPYATAIAALGTFPTFEMHVNGYQGALERVPYLPDGRLDLDGMVRVARRHGGGLLFVPNPDNPSGSSYRWEEIAAFADALPSNSLVIHDEAYANFLPRNRRFPRSAIDPRIIRLRTFSKEYGLAGLRVGYALGAPDAIAALDGLRLLYGVNRIAQVAALAALQDGAFVERVVREVAAGRREYTALARRLGLGTLPSDTNFVLFDFGDAQRATAMMQALLDAGIHVRKPPAPPLDRYVRISVGSAADRALLARALTQMVTGRAAPRRRRAATRARAK